MQNRFMQTKSINQLEEISKSVINTNNLESNPIADVNKKSFLNKVYQIA